MTTPDQRIDKMKKTLIGFMEMVGSLIESTTNETKSFYSEMKKQFRKYEKMIERV